MENMSGLDASFLEVEDAVTLMHIGAVAILEGPPPRYEEIRERVLEKLPLVRRYRQVVRSVALGFGRPVWIDDPHFNLDYHLRRTGLPAPGGEAELRRLAGRVMSQQLDRAKPLWEMWIVEGLEQGRWAIISKVHHCMVDGIAGTDLLTVIFDLEAAPATSGEAAWEPESSPSELQLLASLLAGGVRGSYETARALWDPRRAARRGQEVASGMLRLGGLIRPTPGTSLNGSIGPHRRWSWARAQLSDVKQVRSALGGTVNDVVLACITGGFRALLRSRGESVERVVRTLVPVSVRAGNERGSYNNRVSAIFAELPVGIADPIARLESIRVQTADLKQSKEAVAGEVLTSLAGFAPPLLLALGARVAGRVPQHNVNTVTTNVPGPQFQLFVAGRPMLESFPYVPIAGRVRIGLAIFSYNGAITFGATADYDSTPDVDVLCQGIERSMAELVDFAQGHDQPGRAKQPRRTKQPAPAKAPARAAQRPKRPAAGRRAG
ncbi:MAG TPA: wax ester/triacylglycerol synthase family O-acyltransferase [Solirubrobacteraceae bacterium]|nr:wax ester/triacylglycerol synthase family O-acyltransferase [Solirubrobacteraceae bacterium]